MRRSEIVGQNGHSIFPDHHDMDDNNMFPMVNAPSLELSRTNTPRMSARVPENTRDKLEIHNQKARNQYQKNLPKMNIHMNGQNDDNLKKQSMQSLRKIFESFSSSVAEQIKEDNKRLQEALEQKTEEFYFVSHKAEELEDYVSVLKSQGSKDLELLQTRVLQKAKNERDKAVAESHQKDKELNEIVEKYRLLETENDSLREAINEEIEHLITEVERVEAISGSYKSQEAELSREVEQLKHDLVNRDRKLESLIQVVQDKERKINEADVYIRECEQRNKDLEHALTTREAELEETLEENQKIKMHLDDLMQDDEKKPKDNIRRGPSMSDDERDQYEWKINELKKQLASQSSAQINGGNSRKSPINIDKSGLPDPFSAHSSEISKQTSTHDKSDQCNHLENYFKNLIEMILKESKCLENTSAYSLGELHSLLIQFVRELSTKCQNLEKDNLELQEEFEIYRDRAQEEMDKGMESIEKQVNLIKNENENFKRLVQTQREEIASLTTAVSQRSSAKVGPPRQTILKGSNHKEATFNEATKRNLACQTDVAYFEEVGVQVIDQAGAEKTKHLEKTIKDCKSDISVKIKLIKELEIKCNQLESAFENLKTKEDNEQQGKKKLEQLEKKVIVMNLDIAAKDKKNIELFDTIKKLRSENDTLNQSAKLSSEKSILSKLSSKRTQSTSRKLGTQKTARESFADNELYIEKVNSEVREAKVELSELYKKVDSA